MTTRELQVRVLAKHFFDRGLFGEDITSERVQFAGWNLYGPALWTHERSSRIETIFVQDVRDQARDLAAENLKSGKTIHNILGGL